MSYLITLLFFFTLSCADRPNLHSSNLSLYKTEHFIISSSKDNPATISSNKESISLTFDLMIKNTTLKNQKVDLSKAFFEARGTRFKTDCSFINSKSEVTLVEKELARFKCHVLVSKKDEKFSESDTDSNLIIPLQNDVLNILYRMRMEDFR